MHEPLLRDIRVLGRLLSNLPPVWPCAPLCPSTQRGTCWLDCAVDRLAADGLPFSGCMFRRSASLCLPSPPAYNSRLGSLETLGVEATAGAHRLASSSPSSAQAHPGPRFRSRCPKPERTWPGSFGHHREAACPCCQVGQNTSKGNWLLVIEQMASNIFLS